jgi:hypothetical protein
MCERVTFANGAVAIICGGHRRRRKRCTQCRDWSEFECDVCSVALCRRCRIHVPPDQDYCRGHRAIASIAAAALRERRTGS